MDDNKIEVALEEYRQMWTYYSRTLDERKDLLDWYFKVVTIPTGILGYFATANAPFFQVSPEITAGLLSILFLTGLALFITYAKMSKNASFYDQACQSIRSFFKAYYKDVDEVFIIDELREEKHLIAGFRSVRIWRIMSIIPINAGIGAASIALFFDKYNTLIWILAFALLVLGHFKIYAYFFETHLGA